MSLALSQVRVDSLLGASCPGCEVRVDQGESPGCELTCYRLHVCDCEECRKYLAPLSSQAWAGVADNSTLVEVHSCLPRSRRRPGIGKRHV